MPPGTDMDVARGRGSLRQTASRVWPMHESSRLPRTAPTVDGLFSPACSRLISSAMSINWILLAADQLALTCPVQELMRRYVRSAPPAGSHA